MTSKLRRFADRPGMPTTNRPSGEPDSSAAITPDSRRNGLASARKGLLTPLSLTLSPQGERGFSSHGAAECARAKNNGDETEDGHYRHALDHAGIAEVAEEDGAGGIDGVGERVRQRDVAQPGRRKSHRQQDAGQKQDLKRGREDDRRVAV